MNSLATDTSSSSSSSSLGSGASGWFSGTTTSLNHSISSATESVAGVIGPATHLAVNNGKALFSSVSSSLTNVLGASTTTSSSSTTSPSNTDVESQQPVSKNTNVLSNGFSGIGAALGGYIPVLSSATSSSTPSSPPVNEWTCGLSYAQRFQAFLLLGCGSITLYFASFFIFLPLILITPSKFATSFTFGSLFWLTAFAILRGPRSTIMALLQRDKLPFTLAYIASIILSLYSTLIVQSYFLVLLAVIIQLIAALWYSSSYIPGGTTAFNALGRMMWTTSRSLVGGLVR